MTTTDSKIQVDFCGEETMAWRKKLIVEHEGISYRIDLYWDTNEGYDSWFHDMENNLITDPDWVVQWEEDHVEEYSSFNGYLDELSVESNEGHS
jgi:hypothetical protein